MNRTFILWRLEGKHTIKMLPAMFADALFLLGILGMVALGAAKLFLRDIPAVQITVALVEEDENPLTDMALNYVQGWRVSLKAVVFCRFQNKRDLPCCRRAGRRQLCFYRAA